MAVRIVHTADNHIGMTFNGRSYRAELRDALVRERFDALERTVAIANEKKAHFLVIAGDLFDRVSIASKDIKAVAEILGRLEESQLVLLPGNHDYYEPGKDSLWQVFRKIFPEEKLIFLDDCKRVEVTIGETNVFFYPAPCRSKHSATNYIQWVKDEPKEGSALHIGVAHGSVEGFSADFTQQYFPMSQLELKSAGVDFWLLGHTHIRYPEMPQKQNPVFFFPATPTPDGFDRKHEGYVWYLEVDEKKNISMESLRTGSYRFYELSKTLRSLEDIQLLRKDMNDIQEGTRALVKLNLEGNLSEEEKLELEKAMEDVKSQLAHLEAENNIRLHITAQHIDRLFKTNSLPHRLLSRLSQNEEDNLALQIANELLQKIKA